jgi:dTDP-4-dehydrorhamnose reductase
MTNWVEYVYFVIHWARENGLLVKVASDESRPISTSAYQTPATRLLNSRLSTKKLRETFSLHLPYWHVGVEPVLRETCI